MEWGISSNGRAPALHAGSTGIDTRILQDQCFSYFSFLQFLFTHLSGHKSREVCYFSLLKITILKSFFSLLSLQKRSITFSLYLQQSRMSKMTGDRGFLTNRVIRNPERNLKNCQAFTLCKYWMATMESSVLQ